MRRSTATLALVTTLALAAPSAAQEEAAERADAKRATQEVGRLVAALDQLLADPGLAARQTTALQQREHDAAVSSARAALRHVKELKRRLDGGYSLDESRPFWSRVASSREDIGAYARHSWLPESVHAKADAVAVLMAELAELYAEP